jgi:hypothetical protein
MSYQRPRLAPTSQNYGTSPLECNKDYCTLLRSRGTGGKNRSSEEGSDAIWVITLDLRGLVAHYNHLVLLLSPTLHHYPDW